MDIDLFFYIFGIISLILVLMIAFILKKSTNLANSLFVLTPTFFTTILIFNMLNYFGNIANNFLLWMPYLLAPLGMLSSALYILLGSEFRKQKNVVSFLALYVIVSLLFSIYPDPLQFGNLTGLQQGSMHLFLIIPFLLTIILFMKISLEAPDERWKIYILVAGLIIVALGSILRGNDYILYGNDSIYGMIIIVLGSILALMAFSTVRRQGASNISTD